MAKAEKFVIDNLSLKELFSEKHLAAFTQIDGEIFPVTLVLINEVGNGELKQALPIIISHQTSDEVKQKILHVESPNAELASKIAEILENERT